MRQLLFKFYNSYSWLCSPIPILLLIIAKIYFNKKFSTKAFIISLIASAVLAVPHIIYSYNNTVLPISDNDGLKRNFIEVVNCMDIIWRGCEFISQFFIYFIPLLLTGSIIYLLITKDKSVIKKLFISLLLLMPFVYTAYPFFVLRFQNINKTPYSKETYKYIEEKTNLSSIKACCAFHINYYIWNELHSKFYDRKYARFDLSSNEAKSLVSEFVKYKTIENNTVVCGYGDIVSLTALKQFDTALAFIEKQEKRTGKKSPYRINIYIAKKDYQTALDWINGLEPYAGADLHYAKIYTGLKEFDKAYEYLEKYKRETDNSKSRFNVIQSIYSNNKIYLDYKAGNVELAQEEYEKLIYQTIRNRYNSLDEYIQMLDATGLF